MPPAAFLRRTFPHRPAAVLLATGLGLTLWLRTSLTDADSITESAAAFAAARADKAVRFLWTDAVVLGVHWASLAAGVIFLTLLLTMRWWARPQPGEAEDPVPAPAARLRGYGWALAALTLLSLALRLPLASGSLWWDEMWNAKFATVGEWRTGKKHPDELRFYAAEWDRAAWYYNKPTNHPVLTLPSHAAHLAWQSVTGAPEGTFSEPVLRLPVLLAGVGTLLLAAAVARRLGGPAAGLIAAAAVALHPWLIRYGVDARSYGMTICFATAAVWTLLRLADSPAPGRLRWWGLFGLCQFLLMWAHVLSHAVTCAALAAAALALIWLRYPRPARWPAVWRLLAVNAAAAAAFTLAFLPNLLQALTWQDRNGDGGLLTANSLFRTLCQVCCGMEQAPADDPGLDGIPWLIPWQGWLLAAAGGALVLAGWLALWRKNRTSALILAAIPVAALTFLAGVKFADFYFYHRFIISAAVPLIILAALGARRFPLPGALIFLTWCAFIWPQWRLLSTRSYAPLRETAAALRAADEASGGRLIAIGYGLGGNMIQPYLPKVTDIQADPATVLQEAIATARRENRPLCVAWGYDLLNRANLPDGFPLLDDPALFEPAGIWRGLEPEFTFRMVRLKPSTAGPP